MKGSTKLGSRGSILRIFGFWIFGFRIFGFRAFASDEALQTKDSKTMSVKKREMYKFSFTITVSKS